MVKKFFHKLIIIFKRLFSKSIPYVTEIKQYGNAGENGLVNIIKKYLPDCKIKSNIIIRTSEGNAEIDALILYKDKLFAVEVKSWKGDIAEVNGRMVQKKRDRWTDEIHIKDHKSPFKQLNRAIYLLRKQVSINAWINPIVYFDTADSVRADGENIWFSDVKALANYVSGSGNASYGNNAEQFFKECDCADLICSQSKRRYMYCKIYDKSLCFKTEQGALAREDILGIRIKHHLSYDEFYIDTVYGKTVIIKDENSSVTVTDGEKWYSYALCKLDWLKLGK